MRKFLLTWYGITDFRASLGFENTNGPIAGAVVAEDYSDVVILCYTRADDDASRHVEAREAFAAAWATIREAGLENDLKATTEFVTRFSNTPAAHAHFVRWLKTRVQAAGSSVRILFKGERLRELNDTEGIYACAMRALDYVAKEPAEKLVTLYLSPGTPVMAFVWALAALRYPGLKKRLIVSPVIGKPPEAISLPTEWLERYAAQQQAALPAPDGFDVIFHLFGEQRMPALLGIRQFESRQHVFVNSRDYPATRMRAFLKGAAFDELPVDPWDAGAVQKQIIRYAERLPPRARLGINLTGGTKLMFAGALAAARALGAVPFYFDSRNRRVTYVDSLRSEAIRPINSIETFLLLHGEGLELAQDGRIKTFSSERRLLAETLWKHKQAISRYYNHLCDISTQHEKLRKTNSPLTPFDIECNGLAIEFSKGKVAMVRGAGVNLRFDHWPGFAKYLAGGWFEEFVYLQCKPYEDLGTIQDLRLNVELRLGRQSAGHPKPWNASYNELDVSFTDGYSLYIIECKAGNVSQEQVMKLQNLVRFYGGVEGRGVVACCFSPAAESVRKKIQDARLALCCEDSFAEQIKALMDGITARARVDAVA